MKKNLTYLILLLIYFLIGIVLFLNTSLIGSKPALLVDLICMFVLWIGTVYYMERDNILIKGTKKAAALFNYFDVNAVKDILKIKKAKGERFDMFKGEDNNQKVTVLTVKILNNDVIKKLESERRIRAFGKLLEIIETNIEKRFGIIYNIKDDYITCVFNTVYEIEEPDYEAIIAALNINIDLLAEKKENINLSKIKIDMSIINESMDFYIRGKRVLLNGDLKLAEDLVNIDGEDNIYITEDIFRKYMKKVDAEYLGKFYLSKDVKVYRVIKMLEDNEELFESTYVHSKINIKKGAEKKLQKMAKQDIKEPVKKEQNIEGGIEGSKKKIKDKSE